MKQVKGHFGLRRDINSGAVVNVDKAAYKSFKDAMKVKKAEKEDIKSLKSELAALKSLVETLTSTKKSSRKK